MFGSLTRDVVDLVSPSERGPLLTAARVTGLGVALFVAVRQTTTYRPPEWVFFLLFGLFFASLVSYRQIRAIQLVRNATATTISALDDSSGPVKLSGIALAGAETVTTPYTDRDALVYRARDRYWRSVPRRDAVPFLLDDGTGQVWIEPGNATTNLTWDSSVRGQNEYALEPGSEVTVYGTVTANGRGDLVVDSGDTPPHVLITDKRSVRVLARSGLLAALGLLFGVASVVATAYILAGYEGSLLAFL